MFTLTILLNTPSKAMARAPYPGSAGQDQGSRSILLADVPITVTVPNISDSVDATGPMLNGSDPNYVPTGAELKFNVEKEAQAEQYMQQLRNLKANDLTPNGPTPIGERYLSFEQQWHEPDDWAHRNYCGPGATQVALDARLPAAQVPNIDTIGADENIDPNNGVTTQAIRTELNRLLNVTFYAVSAAADQNALETRLFFDIERGYSMVTALMTLGMPGWGTRNTRHIVATYGYRATAAKTYAYYIETAAPTAGYNGSYYNNKGMPTFWLWVAGNNSQVW
jgi:hypothetical protein